MAHVINSVDTDKWDAQVALVLIWENWNSVFRHDLGFVERSLVSELREFRHRWALSVSSVCEVPTRCVDGIERLLEAVKSDEPEDAEQLRRETLKLLHDDELSESCIFTCDWFKAFVASICGLLMVVVVLEFLPQPLSWVLAALTTIIFSRFVYKSTRATTVINTGPRHSGRCPRGFLW